MEQEIIGYHVTEDCQLGYKNYEAGEDIMIANHCDDNDWPGTVWYNNYPQIFEPIYKEGKQSDTAHTEGKEGITPGVLYIGGQNTIRANNGEEHEWQHYSPFIYSGGNLANAKRLVKCWNEHDSLVNALNELIEACDFVGSLATETIQYENAKAIINRINK